MSSELFKCCADAIHTLEDAVRSDPQYAWSWQCNLAMSAVDEGVDPVTAHKIADRFMYLLFRMKAEEPK